MTSRKARMALARIAAAALMTVAMSAAPSFGASGDNAAAPQEVTLIKFTGDANGAPQRLVLPINKGAVIEVNAPGGAKGYEIKKVEWR